MYLIKVFALERKKLIELIGSVFVALIFLTSYAAFGGGAPGNSTGTTTLTPSQTFYAVANGNATITSYSSVMNIDILCANVSNVSSRISTALQALEKNGSVSNFYSQQAAQMLVQAGNLTTHALFLLLYNDSGSGAACTQFTSTANVKLPRNLTFYLPSQGNSAIISIPSSMQAYSVPITLSLNMSSVMKITASTLLTANGTIYGGIRVQQA